MESRRTALVTGASAGIGKEIAELCAADGHGLVLVARRRERLDELAGELRERHGVPCRVIAEDLGDPQAAPRIHAELAGTPIDILVNNAGFGSNGAFHTLDARRELEMVQVNVTSLVHLTHLFLPAMVERGWGRVLNVGSTAGFQPGPFMATYYASKAFVNSFTEALWTELRGTGVTATVSCPGPVATEFAGIAGNDHSKLFKSASVATPDVIAKQAYSAMMKGRPLVVHGALGKVALQSLRFTPRAMTRKVAASLNRPA
jgi:short-subunit dehydrogenase